MESNGKRMIKLQDFAFYISLLFVKWIVIGWIVFLS